jgi:hypothetical protein
MRKPLCAVVFFLVGSSFAFLFSQTTAITGNVVLVSGAPAINMRLELHKVQGDELVATKITNNSGQFKFANVRGRLQDYYVTVIDGSGTTRLTQSLEEFQQAHGAIGAANPLRLKLPPVQ